jgi:membrane protease YdiL (CAAX protease family)
MTPVFRLIQDPPPSNIFGKGIIVTDVILLSVIPFSVQISIWAATVSLLLAIVAILARDIQSLHLSLFTAALITAPCLQPSLRSWPYALLVPVVGYGFIVLIVPSLRQSILWFHTGNVDRKIVLSVAAVSVISGIALSIWYYALKPDVAIQLRDMPDMPIWLFPLAGFSFAAGNAAMEEFAFRGIIMQSLDSTFGPGFVSILIQAWLFGAMHFLQGFPKGEWGLAMTVVYGIMLGMLRRRSRGILAPWAAHVCADIVIFTILAGIVLKG